MKKIRKLIRIYKALKQIIPDWWRYSDRAGSYRGTAVMIGFVIAGLFFAAILG